MLHSRLLDEWINVVRRAPNWRPNFSAIVIILFKERTFSLLIDDVTERFQLAKEQRRSMTIADRGAPLWMLYYTLVTQSSLLRNHRLKCPPARKKLPRFSPIFLVGSIFSLTHARRLPASFYRGGWYYHQWIFLFTSPFVPLEDNDRYVSFSRWFLTICHYQRILYQRPFAVQTCSRYSQFAIFIRYAKRSSHRSWYSPFIFLEVI